MFLGTDCLVQTEVGRIHRHNVCDLTGGLGIDSYFFSRKVRQVTYIERFPAYCEAAIHNFKVLDVGNVTVLNGDSTELIDKIDGIDVFYIDPARRGEGNKRVFALQDCEPDLTKLVPVLFGHAPKVIAKLISDGGYSYDVGFVFRM
mgnify:CR=1 FL=1